MTCPELSLWDQLSMNLLDEAQAAELLAHARHCNACRQALLDARRDHDQLQHAFQVFDRTHAAEREQMLAALPSDVGPRRSSGWRGQLGDFVMRINTPVLRRSAAVLVPAACVLMAVAVFFNPAQPSAFAAAIERLRTAQTILCQISTPEGLNMNGVHIETDGTLKMSEQYGSTSTLSMNGMEFQRTYAKTGGPVIAVQPINKTWMELDVSAMSMVEGLDQSPDAFIRQLAKLRDGDSAELGPQVIEGQKALGYAIPGPKLGFAPRPDGSEAAHAEMWIGAESHLPVRFELYLTIPNAEGPLHMVYDQFQWDVPLPASDFEPNIPADYVKINAKFARPSEAALINALARLGDLLGGKYPPVFDGISVLGQVHSMMPPENLHKLDDLGQAGIIQLGIEIGGGAMYYVQLVKDGHDPEYFGDTVTAADKDKPLLRWKLDDGKFRVIYGDLHAETVAGE